MGLEVCRYVCRPAWDRRLVSRKASLLYGVIHLVNTQGKGVCKSVRLEVIELLVEGGSNTFRKTSVRGNDTFHYLFIC